MNKIFQVGFFVFLLSCISMANVLTYSASSKKSQKDADQLALEGLAKQLVTKVSSNFQVTTTESASGDVTESVSSWKRVSTNISLKGAKVVPGAKQDGYFQSTASVDTDQMASRILVDLSTQKAQMKSKDSIIRLDMLDRDYRKMATDMVALEKLADDYSQNLEFLSYVQSVPADLKLETTLAELTEFLLASMQSLVLKTELTEKELIVTVNDFAGPVMFFPVALTQENKNLATAKTDKEGRVVFPMAKVKKNKPTGDVTVHADLNFKYIRQSAVINETVHYGSKMTGCTYKVECDGPAEACGAFSKLLNDSGIATLDKNDHPQMSVKMSFSDKANSGKTLYTSRGTFTLQSGSNQMTEGSQGVGRDADAAQVKAVEKLPAAKIFDMFGKNCH